MRAVKALFGLLLLFLMVVSFKVWIAMYDYKAELLRERAEKQARLELQFTRQCKAKWPLGGVHYEACIK